MLCVGYAGCEAFDVILYISRTLTKINYRILIIDLSASGAFFHSIKHGMGLDSQEEIINYRGINYIRKMPSKEELDEFHSDVVFVAYGFNPCNQWQIECNLMNVVVNAFPNITEKVKALLKAEDCQEKDCRLLIRDVTEIDDVDRIKKEVVSYDFNKVNFLYLDINDYESAILCQLSQIVHFTRISAQMQKYILEQIHDMFPHLKYRKIKRAMGLARKGV